MYSPQCFFSFNLIINPYYLHSFNFDSTYFQIFYTYVRALRIYYKAFQCFFISLRIAALFKQVGTISYFYYYWESAMRRYQRSMAKLTAFRAIINFLFFFKMQAKLLKVSIFSFERVTTSQKYFSTAGIITTSTAFPINLLLPSSSSFRFSIASLLIFCINFPISAPNSNPSSSFILLCLSPSNNDRCINFYSLKMHSNEFYYPRSRKRFTTDQIYPRICKSVIVLSQISGESASVYGEIIENIVLGIIRLIGQKKIAQKSFFVSTISANLLFIYSDDKISLFIADFTRVLNILLLPRLSLYFWNNLCHCNRQILLFRRINI